MQLTLNGKIIVLHHHGSISQCRNKDKKGSIWAEYAPKFNDSDLGDDG
jgi:hypothetical protein